jgi:Concanavalin A-like lectin/glucanases superfamily
MNFWRTLIFLSLVAGLAIGTSDRARAALTHRYSFNDGTAADSVGNADGTLSGNASIGGGQLSLNMGGTTRDGVVNLLSSGADGINVNTYSALTVEFWATPNSATDPPGVAPNLNDGFSTAVAFGKINGTNAGLAGNYVLMQTHRGDDVSRGSISISDDGDPWTEESGANGAELNDQAEHQYVVAIDGTNISWYVDGALAGSNPLSATNMLSGVSTEFARIGSAYPNDQNWAGMVNDLRIYDMTFSDADIRASYGRGADGAAIPEPVSAALAGLASLGGLALLRRKARLTETRR